MSASSSITRRSQPPPRAVIEWPGGLDEQPIIYPAGGSDQADDEIREILKPALLPVQIGKAAA